MSENRSDVPRQPGRRQFIYCVSAGAALQAMSGLRVQRELLSNLALDVVIVDFTAAGVALPPTPVPKIVMSESEWRKRLSPLAFDITRRAGTERAFTGAYWNLHDTGIFRCVCCNTPLFSSAHKFDSGTGWPSFWKPIAAQNVVGPKAQSRGADATEVTCRRCDAHLGDIFDDGPRPTGLRYCIDSIALTFNKLV